MDYWTIEGGENIPLYSLAERQEIIPSKQFMLVSIIASGSWSLLREPSGLLGMAEVWTCVRAQACAPVSLLLTHHPNSPQIHRQDRKCFLLDLAHSPLSDLFLRAGRSRVPECLRPLKSHSCPFHSARAFSLGLPGRKLPHTNELRSGGRGASSHYPQ